MTEAFEVPFTVRQGGGDSGSFTEWQEMAESLKVPLELWESVMDFALVAGSEDETAPWEITVVWRIEPDTGSAEPVAVSAKWRPLAGAQVSAEGWRTASIGAAIRETRHRLQYLLGRMGTEATDPAPFSVAAGALQEPRRAGRPTNYDAEHYESVARIYNEALTSGERDPVRIVALRMAASLRDPSLKSSSDKRAKYWVSKARKRGLLNGIPDRGRPRAAATNHDGERT